MAAQSQPIPPTDGHVHILSPELIKVWKGMGIPFSRPDEYYSDIETILRNMGERIDLVSMAHVYSSEEFGGTFTNERVLVEGENSAGSELGHLIIDYNEEARLCSCGQRGHIEAYQSVPPRQLQSS